MYTFCNLTEKSRTWSNAPAHVLQICSQNHVCMQIFAMKDTHAVKQEPFHFYTEKEKFSRFRSLSETQITKKRNKEAQAHRLSASVD